jgi:plastocyanin
MRRVRLAAVSFLVTAALAPGGQAHALVPWQVLAYSGGYVPSEITVVQGDSLTLVNADTTLAHDLHSGDSVGGKPLFHSKVIAFGEQADVVGVALLPPSVYPFYCSVHEYMTGNITVLAAP